MQVKLLLHPDEIVSVFEQVQITDDINSRLGEARAPDFSKVSQWVDQIWTNIKLAVQDVSVKGEDQIEIWTERIKSEISEMREDLGDSSNQVLTLIKEKLESCRLTIWQSMVNMLPASLNIKGETVTLSEIEVGYELSTEVGIEASLAWALKLAAGGTMSVLAHYVKHGS
jgi:hypothetical protein